MPNVISGCNLDSKRFVGVTTLGELISAGMFRPSLDMKGAKDQGNHARQAYDLRQEVQRRFDIERVRRAKAYSRYILGVQEGTIKGGVPPINLFIANPVAVTDTTLTLPTRSLIVAIDGETQTEARFMLLEDEGIEEVADWPIAVVAWHNCDTDEARQFLVDVNKYCSPIDSKITLSMDSQGRLTQTVKKVLELSGIDNSSVNAAADTPGVRKRISLRQIQAAVAGVALNGFTYGRSYANILAELNHPFPAHPAFSFDSDAVAARVAEIVKVAEASEAVQDSGPLVFLAAGVLVKQGAKVETLDFKRASQVHLGRSAGSVAKKLDLLKAAL